MDNKKDTKVRRGVTLTEIVQNLEKNLGFKNEIKWVNFILISLYHIGGAYWCYYFAFPVKWQTVVFGEYCGST